MPIDRARQKIIREHTRKQEQDVHEKGGLRQEKLIVKGRAMLCPIYNFDLRELAFNKANGRIKAEVAEREAELGRQLVLFDKTDQEIIKHILLSMRQDENEKVKEDLRKYGQRTHGIITCDGIVINGNRRKALLEKLYEETRDDRFRYLDVQVLPSDITKAEIWLIEAGIQMSAPQQLDYSPINHLLKLREGINAGLEPDDMASRIYGVSTEKIKADLERLDLIDEYLSDFLGREGKYYLVKNVNEHFIDLQSIISWAKHPRGRVRMDWKWDENDITELKLVAFYYIRLRMSHWRIRELRDLFATRAAWNKVRQALKVHPELTEDERNDLGLDAMDEPDNVDEVDTKDDTEAVTALEERHLQEEAHWRDQRKSKLKSLYEDAKEQEQIIKDSERPLSLAKRALRNIEAIPCEPNKLDEAELDRVLAQIIEKTNVLRKLICKIEKRVKKSRHKSRKNKQK